MEIIVKINRSEIERNKQIGLDGNVWYWSTISYNNNTHVILDGSDGKPHKLIHIISLVNDITNREYYFESEIQNVKFEIVED